MRGIQSRFSGLSLRVLNRAFQDKAVNYPDLYYRYEINNEIDRDKMGAKGFVMPKGRKLQVVHYIGQLGPGGSERQLCNAAVEIREMGFDVAVVTARSLEGEYRHFLPYLTTNDVPVRVAEACSIDDIVENLSDHRQLNIRVLRSLPIYLSSEVHALVRQLISLKPDILHCWLDPCNIAGGLAGIALGIPRIILSGRNVNPTHFPLINEPWFRDWYNVLLRSRRLVFTNNSKTGAADYARWLGIAPTRIEVIYNGVDVTEVNEITCEDVTEFKRSLGIGDRTPLVGGVFRLGPEKRPFDFVAVIKRVKAKVASVKAVVAGVGVLRREVEECIREVGLEDTITLLGGRNDIFKVIKACDVVLHAAEHEGSPNILMEAQSLGIPVVATMAGGTSEVVESSISGLLHPVGDIKGLSESVIRVLHDKGYRKKLGEAGRKLVAERFSMDEAGKALLGIYNRQREVWYSSKVDIIYYRSAGLFLPAVRDLTLAAHMPRLAILSILKRFRMLLNKRIVGVLTDIKREQGYCYTAGIPEWIVSDAHGKPSSLRLFENGIPLAVPHSVHDNIRDLGEGRFSHWFDHVYFSTSDNSDPRTNGRTYSFSE
jgi:glycosyltransferase involved in cell wall biosynthesis